MAESAFPHVEHSPVVTGDEEFKGFANDPVDKDGKRVAVSDVPGYDDETEDGAERKSFQETESSIVQNRSEGPSTNGAPAAQVPAPDAEPKAEVTSEEDAEDEDAAGGQGANEA